MFASIYFPIFDGRSFYPTRDALARRPTWPSLAPPGHAFQRNLGPINPRPLGGIRGWVGEEEVCEIQKSLTFKAGDRPKELRKFAPQFSRLYSDGAGGVQFSIGFKLGRLWLETFSEQWLEDNISDALHSKIKSKHSEHSELIYKSGEYISRLYSAGTQRGNKNTSASRGVRSGPPLMFIHLTHIEQFKTLKSASPIFHKKIGESDLYICISRSRHSRKINTPAFYIYTGSKILKERCPQNTDNIGKNVLRIFRF
ncbi:MAG: hypothetical protein P0Y59_13845 [Candidatus Sphingomonas phytovorans]|nr:hypothetical protein [Sphingomonas sp.]WEJ98040.1 MAG: hypothetical protein P0Y59_13845 [Sphingomonas sp.]